MIFNPLRTRAGFDEFLLEMMLNASAEPGRPKGKLAESDVGDVIKAWLVGLRPQVAPVLDRSIQWLAQAISEGEKVGREQEHRHHEFVLHESHTLGCWLRGDGDLRARWATVRERSQAAVVAGSGYTPDWIAKDRLDDEMAYCVLAEQYELGIGEYEKYWEAKPPSLKKALAPRELGYALCLHHGRGELDAAALSEAVHKMLRARLEERWLGAGQDKRAAIWLAAVYRFQGPTLTPYETVLRAYDDMPNVTRPDALLS